MNRLKDRELHDLTESFARQVEAQKKQKERFRLAKGFSIDESSQQNRNQRMDAGEVTLQGNI